MRFYRYEARDSQGKLIQGTVQALSESAVQKDLTDKGIRLVKIEPLGGGQAPPNQVYPSQPVSGLTAPTSNTPPTNAPPSNTPRPRPAAANVNVYQTPPRPAQSPVINAPQPGRTQQTIHTKAGTDKQRFFIFSQLASAYRAGINAGDVFAQVANRSAEQFGPSLRHASNAAMEGLAVSEVFAQYPDLYPPDVVGLTRAGEAAGFLPDAFDEIGRQAESAHSFKRWFFWIWFLAINTLLSIPLMMVTKGAILRDWNDQNSSGGSHTEASFFLVEMWREFLWPWGPLTLVSYAAVFALNR